MKYKPTVCKSYLCFIITETHISVSSFVGLQCLMSICPSHLGQSFCGYNVINLFEWVLNCYGFLYCHLDVFHLPGARSTKEEKMLMRRLKSLMPN